MTPTSDNLPLPGSCDFTIPESGCNARRGGHLGRWLACLSREWCLMISGYLFLYSSCGCAFFPFPLFHCVRVFPFYFPFLSLRAYPTWTRPRWPFRGLDTLTFTEVVAGAHPNSRCPSLGRGSVQRELTWAGECCLLFATGPNGGDPDIINITRRRRLRLHSQSGSPPAPTSV